MVKNKPILISYATKIWEDIASKKDTLNQTGHPKTKKPLPHPKAEKRLL
jgi:hypothetical protein